jgi:sec-independent protein translocase protein TatC
MADQDTQTSRPGKGEMTMLGHIAELRSTILWSLGLALAAAIVAWFFSDQIVNELLNPAREAGQKSLYFTAPMEAFLLKLKASSAVGLFLVLPLILFKLYSFVTPGLLPREKKVVTPLLVAATGLFYVGVAFCFFILLPMVIRFAVGFATEQLQPLLTAREYFGLAVRLCLAFGLLFELPMVVLALSWAGVVKPRTLLRGWRYALIAILTASAILTPPDVISQVVLAGPVMVLYMASVVIALLMRRRRDRKSDDIDS